MVKMTIDEIMNALMEGRISIDEAMPMLFGLGFSGQLPTPGQVVIRRQGLRAGRDKFPTRKEMYEHRDSNICDVCETNIAAYVQNNGKKLCTDCAAKELVQVTR